ncbi:MAG: hypothetical protein ACRD2L_21975 [Terriglobia bacterium]
MLGTGTAVVATGRFQRLHLGSIQYLLVAKYLAKQTRSSFFVLTGPFDAELDMHGWRSAEPMDRRFLSFEERRLILSCALDISQDSILNHSGSPHHGEPGLADWINGFFLPLVANGLISQEALLDATRSALALITAIKPEDIRQYREGRDREHYADLIKDAYPAICIIDYFTLLGRAPSLERLSSSKMPMPTVRPSSSADEESSALAPAMLLTEMLLAERGVSSILPFADSMILVSRKFGTSPTSRSAIRASVPEIF